MGTDKNSLYLVTAVSTRQMFTEKAIASLSSRFGGVLVLEQIREVDTGYTLSTHVLPLSYRFFADTALKRYFSEQSKTSITQSTKLDQQSSTHLVEIPGRFFIPTTYWNAVL